MTVAVGSHPAQQTILRVVTERPGVCVQDLAEATGLTRTATMHHIKRLAKAGQLVQVRQGRRVLHFLPAATGPQGLLGLLHVHTARRVVEGLMADPHASWRHLARQLGITPRAVRWHIRKLEQQGALRVHPSFFGPGHVVVVNAELRAVLGLDAPEPPPGLPAAAPSLDATVPP